MSEAWTPNGEPFCWQPKAALRKIRESLDGENTVATAIETYVAITEVASDKQAAEFQTTYGFLSMRSGLSPRTIQARVKDLVSLGLLKFSVPKVKAPGTFKLVSVRQPLPNDAQPLPDDRQPLKQASLPRSEESPEESLKEREKKSSAGASECERIYAAYPRKEARQDALKAIARALKKIPCDQLLAKTVAYAAHCRATGQDLKYVPHPATWFNGERWNDPLPSATPQPARQSNGQTMNDPNAIVIEGVAYTETRGPQPGAFPGDPEKYARVRKAWEITVLGRRYG